MSVSRRDVWKTCSQQYKYKYELQLEPCEETPFYFTYGSIIHKIAEEYVINRGERLLSDITEDVLQGTIPLREVGEPIKLPSEYAKRLPGNLKAIEQLTQQIGVVGETEYEFEYDLDPPNKRMLAGVIDRLIIKDDKCWIIDYKTTRRGRWRKRSVVDDIQLRCYARVVQKQFGILAENIKAALYYLEGAELVAAKYSNESLEQVEQEMLQAYKQIECTPPEVARGSVGEHCQRCDYKSICPFLKAKKNIK